MPDSPAQDQSPLRHPDRLIPIVLGVVGHRDIHLKAIDGLTASLNEVFLQFEEAYPNSPLMVLTPLAPGADQLVARVALDRKCGRWSVRAPLALPPDLLLSSSSFHDDDTGELMVDAVNEFNNLILDKRVDWFVVPVPPKVEQDVAATGVPLADIMAKRLTDTAETRRLRSTYYANAGGYIVRHCHTLIALWDEKHAERPSGTAESLRFQLGGLSHTDYPWTAHEPLGFDGDRGPALVLYTPRKDVDTAKKKRTATDEQLARAGKRTVRVPTGEDKEYGLYYGRAEDVPHLARRFTRLGRLFARVRRAWGERQAGEKVGWHTRLADWFSHQLGGPGRTEYDQFLGICQTIDEYNVEAAALPAVKADDLSKLFPPGEGVGTAHYKTGLAEWYRKFSLVKRTGGDLCKELDSPSKSAPLKVSIALAVILLLLHCYAHPPWHFDTHTPPDHPPLVLGAFFAVWLVLAGWVLVRWFRRVDERFVDYRALVEALRTRQAWAAAGLGLSVSDSYLGQLRGELVWVRRALLHLCPPPQFWAAQFDALPDPRRRIERLEGVEKDWVRGQCHQHHKNSGKEHGEGRRKRRRGFFIFAAGLFLLGIQSCLPYWAEKEAHAADHSATADGHAKPKGEATGEPHAPAHAAAKPATRPPLAAVLGGSAAAVEPAHPAVTGGHSDPGHESNEAHPQHEGDAKGQGEWHFPFLNPHPFGIYLVAGGMLMVIGGILVALCEKLGHEFLARQYERIYVVFRSGSRELEVILRPSLLKRMQACKPDGAPFTPDPKAPAEAGADVARAQKVIEELGREAIQENAQWVLGRRSKPLELPLGA